MAWCPLLQKPADAHDNNAAVSVPTPQLSNESADLIAAAMSSGESEPVDEAQVSRLLLSMGMAAADVEEVLHKSGLVETGDATSAELREGDRVEADGGVQFPRDNVRADAGEDVTGVASGVGGITGLVNAVQRCVHNGVAAVGARLESTARSTATSQRAQQLTHAIQRIAADGATTAAEKQELVRRWVRTASVQLLGFGDRAQVMWSNLQSPLPPEVAAWLSTLLDNIRGGGSAGGAGGGLGGGGGGGGGRGRGGWGGGDGDAEHFGDGDEMFHSLPQWLKYLLQWQLRQLLLEALPYAMSMSLIVPPGALFTIMSALSTPRLADTGGSGQRIGSAGRPPLPLPLHAMTVGVGGSGIGGTGDAFSTPRRTPRQRWAPAATRALLNAWPASWLPADACLDRPLAWDPMHLSPTLGRSHMEGGSPSRAAQVARGAAAKSSTALFPLSAAAQGDAASARQFAAPGSGWGGLPWSPVATMPSVCSAAGSPLPGSALAALRWLSEELGASSPQGVVAAVQQLRSTTASLQAQLGRAHEREVALAARLMAGAVCERVRHAAAVDAMADERVAVAADLQAAKDREVAAHLLIKQQAAQLAALQDALTALSGGLQHAELVQGQLQQAVEGEVKKREKARADSAEAARAAADADHADGAGADAASYKASAAWVACPQSDTGRDQAAQDEAAVAQVETQFTRATTAGLQPDGAAGAAAIKAQNSVFTSAAVKSVADRAAETGNAVAQIDGLLQMQLPDDAQVAVVVPAAADSAEAGSCWNEAGTGRQVPAVQLAGHKCGRCAALVLEKSEMQAQLQSLQEQLVSSGQDLQLQRDQALQERDQALQECDEAQQERDEAQQERDEAQQERDQAQQERDQAQQERDQALQAYDLACQDRDQAQLHRDQTMQERDEAQQARDQAQQDCDAACREYDAVREERDKACHKSDQALKDRIAAQQERDAAVQQRDSAQQERDTAQQERDAAQQERNAAVQQCTAAQQERDVAQQEWDSSAEQHNLAVQDRDVLQQQRDAAQQERDSAVQERDMACESSAELVQQLEHVQQQLIEAQAACGELQVQQELLSQQRGNLQRKCDHLQDRCDGMAAASEQQGQRALGLQVEADALQAREQLLQEKCVELQARCERLQVQFDSLVADKEQQEQQAEALQADHDVLQACETLLTRQCGELRETCDQLQARCDRLQRSGDELQRGCDQLVADREAMQRCLDSAEASSQAQVAQAEGALVALVVQSAIDKAALCCQVRIGLLPLSCAALGMHKGTYDSLLTPYAHLEAGPHVRAVCTPHPACTPHSRHT